MSYGDPGPGHRNALQQIADARQNALKAVSKMRQAGPPPHHPHLAPVDDDHRAVATLATQAVVDYLIQLRPYRGNSAGWEVGYGRLDLPKRLPGKSHPGRSNHRGPDLRICTQPKIFIQNVSDFVEVANMTVQYSSKRRTGTNGDLLPGTQKMGNNLTPQDKRVLNSLSADTDLGEFILENTDDATYQVTTEEYGELEFDTPGPVMAIQRGSLSPSEAVEFAMTADETDESDSENDFVLGDPHVNQSVGDTPGPDHTVRSFNVVFGADELQRFAAHGDDVAAELDILADLEAPDHSAGPGGAV